MRKMLLVVTMLMVIVGCSGKSNISLTGPSDVDAASNSKAADGLLSPAGETVLGFNFTNSTIYTGEEIVVDVMVENVNNLFGGGYTIDFDSSLLQFIRIEEGGFLKSKNPTWLASAINNEGLVVGLTSLGKVEGVGGTGVLTRITFKALKQGEAKLDFKDFTFREPLLIGETDQDWSKRSISLSSRGATISIK